MCGQSLSSSLCGVESCQYENSVGLPRVRPSDNNWRPHWCSRQSSRKLLAYGSSATHTVSWAWNKTASQWELKSTLPFPSCFLYNLKFLASQLLGLPPAFRLVSCSAYLTLKMEALCSSEVLVDFQQTT
jgi:hypothetical protein